MTRAMTRALIAVLRGVRPDEVEAITAALLEAGIGTVEVTMNSPDPLDSIARIARRFGEDGLIGAGTVLTAAEVARVRDCGGRLIVSPDCNPEVIRASKAADMVSCPGVFTATEAFAALRAGADILKLFPASVLGPGGLSALRAVLPTDSRLYAVGGVGPDDFAAWRTAGAAGFGLGGNLYRPGDTAAEVTRKARTIVAAYDAALGIAAA